jgi:hypothetical protein
MTPDEKRNLEARLAESSRAAHRIDRLSNAIAEIQAEAVLLIAIPISDQVSDSIYYSESNTINDRSKWKSVCWSGKEPGLAVEIRDAVLAILSKRLADATHEFAKA